jgi:hypothetical protein
MSEKLEQQLQTKTLEELKTLQAKATNTKAELETLKTKGGKDWTDEQQNKLDNVVLFLVDVEEAIEAKSAEAETKSSYTPAPGTEKLVHLKIVHGRRFNPRTGKEESQPYTQLFSYGEFALFAKSAAQLGYSVIEVLHDPYGKAKDLVVTD